MTLMKVKYLIICFQFNLEKPKKSEAILAVKNWSDIVYFAFYMLWLLKYHHHKDTVYMYTLYAHDNTKYYLHVYLEIRATAAT